ncbi:MAG: DUF6390 family protein, partial [bacterium]|nr:DUF6390 family protein [bacterium]
MNAVSNSSPTDGILRCSRYAFGPNRLHYCGPDANREIFSYIEAEARDPGLEILLKAFRTMYPYLKFIAQANKIKEPFDNRVVEAYWIGNELLEDVDKNKFYRHLVEEHGLKKKLDGKSFERLTAKLRQGAVPTHSFHVLDVWRRTGHIEREHTLESMDSCRISWGTVKKLDGPFIAIETEPLIYKAGKLTLGEPVQKRISRYFNAHPDIEELKVGEIVSVHWDVPCEM